ncbi:MAG: hypothetical protein RLZZ241_1105 [Bacteroidota bacterium]
MTLLLPALAVLLSFAALLLWRQTQRLEFGLLLAFSGAFLLGLTLFELLPEAYLNGNSKITGACIAAGILLQLVLEYFSKGAEHGHVHHHSGHKFPWLLLCSLCLHAFLEGIPLGHNTKFLWGIVIHKIPVALILGGFLLHSRRTKKSGWFFMVLFSIMTPIGALLGTIDIITSIYPYLLALVIGVVLHVATIILFESSEGHSLPWRKLLVILAGMVLGYCL